MRLSFQEHFAIWDKLTADQQSRLSAAVALHRVERGAIVHNGSISCTGLILVKTGQLRAYILSDEGREITLYRLFDMDICMLSAPCMMSSIQFDITIEAEKDSEIWIIPPHVYRDIMQVSAPVANYTNEIMATRLTEVMWLMEQIMWKSLDKRVASFLLEEAAIEGTESLKLTHETIAKHLGTHREVVTRMLRYFQSEEMVSLSRGTVEITDREALEALCGG